MNHKPLKIFIDHYGDEEPFVVKLIKRLDEIKVEHKTTYFGSFLTTDRDWEEQTLKAIYEADIVIPIVTQSYLAWVSQPIRDAFNNIGQSKNKFLFPINYSPADWGVNKWMVRSKLFPSDSTEFSHLTNAQQTRVTNELISTINQIGQSLIGKTEDVIVELEEKSETGTLVFISHDHDDADFAELLKLKLEKEGIVGWIDSEKLKIGQDWRVEIDESIDKSLALIVVMSPEARKSEYVTYEWAYAWGRNIKIFPIMLKQTPLHPRLESLQYLDFTKRESRPYNILIESIKSLM